MNYSEAVVISPSLGLKSMEWGKWCKQKGEEYAKIPIVHIRKKLGSREFFSQYLFVIIFFKS